jgi:hypothetical protein
VISRFFRRSISRSSPCSWMMRRRKIRSESRLSFSISRIESGPALNYVR